MALLKRNPFGHILILKKWLIRILGVLTHRRFRGFNEMHIEGSEIIKNLPDTNVLFISNHQTYFADVVSMFHVFNASLSGRVDSIKNVGYLWNPKLNIYYVAAKETMRAGLLPKILAYVGSISIERTWRAEGKDVNRQVKMSDISSIGKALKDGWVITFPQGTTTPFKPIRKGTAHIIKRYKPVVIPIVIDGFRRSFDKKGLRIKKKNILQSFIIKEPLEIDYDNETIEEIVEKIEFAIEQHPSFLKVIPVEELEEQKRLDDFVFRFYTSSDDTLLKMKILQTNSGRVSKSKVMSFLYQTAETIVMDIISTEIKILGKKVLARVHDAIFIDTKLTNYDKSNIEFNVRDTTGIDYITLDEEKLKGFKGVSALVKKEEAEEKSLLAAQALLAQKNSATL